MKPIITFILLLSVATSAFGANAALVIRDDGYYLLTSDSEKLIKISCVVDQRANPDDPPTPDEPDEPTAPTERAEKIGALTQGVGTHEEAVTLAAVSKALADQGVTGQLAWDAAFRLTLNRVSGSVSQEWAAWKSKVDALAGGYPAQFFADVSAGIAIAHDVDASAVQEVAAVAIEFIKTGNLSAALKSLGDINLGLKPGEINLAGIIELIKMILQLLNDLGIFPPAGAEGACLPLESFRIAAYAFCGHAVTRRLVGRA